MLGQVVLGPVVKRHGGRLIEMITKYQSDTLPENSR
jgi:hypothetical protein